MKIQKLSIKDNSVFWAEAELAGVMEPIHFMEYSSREHSCPTGKDVYLTYENATRALRMRKNRRRSKDVYKCNICGHFHLTSRDGEGRRKKEFSRATEKRRTKNTHLRHSDAELLSMAHKANERKVTRPGKWATRYRDMKLAAAS